MEIPTSNVAGFIKNLAVANNMDFKEFNFTGDDFPGGLPSSRELEISHIQDLLICLSRKGIIEKRNTMELLSAYLKESDIDSEAA